MDIHVECFNGISVEVSHCAFINAGISVDSLELNGSDVHSMNSSDTAGHCEAHVDELSDLIHFDIPSGSDCGTVSENNGTHLLYSNKITGKMREEHDSLIYRERVTDIHFSCAVQIGQFKIICTFL